MNSSKFTSKIRENGYSYPEYISVQDILDRITIQDKTSIPNFILSLGPCRSGTNASLRVYAESGIKAFSQPLKGIFRHLSKRKPITECGWFIPDDEYIYVKETNGPFTCEESTFDSLKIIHYLFKSILSDKYKGEELDYQSNHLMSEKIQVIIMGRQPFDTWYSWEAAFHHIIKGVASEDLWYYDIPWDRLFDLFLVSYRNVEQLRRDAIQRGIKVSHYVAEANRQPEIAIPKLFSRLGLNVEPKISSWSQSSELCKKESRVILSNDHSTQIKANMFNKVNNSEGIVFHNGKGHLLSKEIKKCISDAGLLNIYESWKISTEKDLDINIGK